MQFQLTIQTDNAAFEQGAREVARILRVVAARLVNGGHFDQILFDANGNIVGQAGVRMHDCPPNCPHCGEEADWLQEGE